MVGWHDSYSGILSHLKMSHEDTMLCSVATVIQQHLISLSHCVIIKLSNKLVVVVIREFYCLYYFPPCT